MPLLNNDSSIEGETPRRKKERMDRNEALLKEWADEDKQKEAKPDVFEPLPMPAELVKLDDGEFSRYRVGDVDIKCPVCGKFHFRRSSLVLVSRGMLFFRLAWLNGGATALHCQNCRSILWIDERGGSDVVLFVILAIVVVIATVWVKSNGG